MNACSAQPTNCASSSLCLLHTYPGRTEHKDVLCCTYMIKAGLCAGPGELAGGEKLSSNVTETSEQGLPAKVAMIEAAGRVLLHFPKLIS